MKNAAVSEDPKAVDLAARLSAAARSVWAKYDHPDTELSLPLHRHLADSAAVAGHLWDEWVPRHVRELIAEDLPGGMEDARRLAVWLAGTHDIGKATPAFACQVESLAQSMRAIGLTMPGSEGFADRRIAPHGLAGQLLLRDWLAERHGWSGKAAGAFTIIAGGHHGVPPGFAQIHDLDLHPELLRSGDSERLWAQVQWELLDACAEAFGVGDRLSEWRTVKLSQQAQVLLTAIVIVSDWIASDPALFPYLPPGRPDGDARVTPEKRVAAAWNGLRLPVAWSPSEPEGSAAELFEARFDLPSGSAIRPVQQDAVRLAREMSEPGLLVIEAPMGEGKTEAALAVAEIFAARGGAGGCFVALPTRATSNAMFGRLLTWLRHLPGDTDLSVHLAHAKAALDEEFGWLLNSAPPVSAIDIDGPDSRANARRDQRSGAAELVAHRWLRGRKKGMLASFAVGTIDQLLFAGLKSRHLALRHLALVGKVVVIDEVHAYDAYMSVYLERVLSWLGKYRIPVVMLSATLPADRRRALVEAYAGSQSAEPDLGHEDPAAYPLLTAVAPGSQPVTARPAAAADRATRVHLESLGDDPGALADRLARELADGGCALVVRNTVGRVLQTAERLRERFGAAHVTVAHSRFVDVDRARKDSELLERFGPTGKRPDMHIVVASQVAEQSLDIDFDILVTDLAPIDLLLQRMGRLHRHPRGGTAQTGRPARLRIARCLVTGVDWAALPPEPVGGSVAVYKRFPLLRSLAVLQPHLAGQPVSLPTDISPLVQRGYGESCDMPEAWAEAMEEAGGEHAGYLRDQRERAGAFCIDEVRAPGRPLVGWIDGGVGDADDTRAGRAQVRDSAETIEVIVVQRRADGALATLPWLDRGLGGLELPTDTVPPPRASRGAAASALRLPYHFSQPWMFERVVKELEQTYVAAWQSKQSPWLAGELILVLDDECRTRLAGYELHYDKDNGMEVTLAGERDVKLVHSARSFDLVSSPWLPVLRLDGTGAQLSLREVFEQAGGIRRLVGDLPTQEFALLRLLLAIAHDAVEGPRDIDHWDALWAAKDPFSAVPAYLDRHRDRFDLLHPTTPFYQVAGLRTEKNEVGSLDKIVADVPNGEPFFTMRMPGVGRLTFAEAARWVVHTHAFDTSGIKSGVVGDPKAVGGKRYPQGVGWAGTLGGVYAEGHTLRETLLLNLIAADTGNLQFPRGDLPAWRRDPENDQDTELPRGGGPSGLRDLYTWQSRRMLLHHDTEGVVGVVLTYGDPLTPHNRHGSEPMTGWRRSGPQEKKLGMVPVYMPREHDPARAAWRGLAGLLAGTRGTGEVQSGEAAPFLRPAIVEWLARLTVEESIDRRRLLRVRTVSAVYGTQQSIIDEVIDDSIAMPVVLLHEGDPRFGQCAVDAVADAEAAVAALGDLAANLAAAAGAEPDPQRLTARDRGFGALDGPYRHWLRDLGTQTDPVAARIAWQDTAHRIIREQAAILLNSAGLAAAQGRTVRTARGDQWMDDALASLWFRGRLNKVLSLRPRPAPTDQPSDEESQP
jgi:CRISPR system Cascade subunit CasA